MSCGNSGDNKETEVLPPFLIEHQAILNSQENGVEEKTIAQPKLEINGTESVSVVTIGSQVWTSKNLDVATYRNGDVIPQVQDNKAWEYLQYTSTGAWCYYDNDASNGTKYGKLYNWYAVNDPRGLAPKGYHIPTETEWTKLIDYLGGDVEAGAKMRSTNGWYDDRSGTIRDVNRGTNSSGFSGLPGGGYNGFIHFTLGLDGNWWSSTEINPFFAKSFQLGAYTGIYRGDGRDKEHGFSVRCLRD